MPSKRQRITEADDLSRQLSEVVGRPVGFRKVLSFLTNADAARYRKALYQRRYRMQWPDEEDPWGEVEITLLGTQLILTRGASSPGKLPTPINEKDLA